MAASLTTDQETAQYVCRQLQSNNRRAILIIYSSYSSFFQKFVYKRLSFAPEAEDILADFWVKLLDGKALCQYRGDRGASLQTYLCRILENEIRDYHRKKSREPVSLPSGEKFSESASWPSLSPVIDPPAANPENGLIRRDNREILSRLIHEALLKLNAIAPRDARLVFLKLQGKGYLEMAMEEISLASIPLDQEYLPKKIDAVKKQFTRPRTGSLARFKVILERLLKEYELERGDLFSDDGLEQIIVTLKKLLSSLFKRK